MVVVNFLVAAAGTGAEPVTNAIAVGSEGFALSEASLADWIVQGGIMMIPIILCSIIALAIILERSFTLRHIRLEAERFFSEIRRIVSANRITEALIICENSKSPMARIVKTALLAREKSSEEIRLAVEESAERESGIFERYLPALGTIGTISPLLGLLGTVLGMIKSSNFLATSGIANTAGLIGGISEAFRLSFAITGLAPESIGSCSTWKRKRMKFWRSSRT